jgi:hypothetical protein
MFEHFLYAAGTEILAHVLGYYVATVEHPGLKYNWCYAKCGVLSLLLSATWFIGVNPDWPIEAALMWGLGFNKFLRCGIRYASAKRWID